MSDVSAFIRQIERKAAALDRLERFSGGISYGGAPLKWDGTKGSLLKAIEDSDERFRRERPVDGVEI